MSDTLGKTLAATRVKKGLSVEEVSSITRVNAKFIRLIEEDKYDQLPGEVFIRGLLRSYAGVVGLSGDEVVARYNALGVSIKDRNPELISVPLHPKPRWVKTIVMTAISVSAVIGILYYYLAPLEPSDEKPFASSIGGISSVKKPLSSKVAEPQEPSMVSDSEPEQAPETKTELKPEAKTETKPDPQEKTAQTAPSQSPITAQQPPVKDEPKKAEPKPAEPVRADEKTAVRPPAQTPAVAAEKGKRKLTVTASDVSWISVTIDGSVTRQVFLNAGETVAWVGEKKFRITIGNAAATKVYLDGVEVKLKNALQNVVKEMEIPANKVEKPEGSEG